MTSVIYIVVLALTFKDFYMVMQPWVAITQAIGVVIIVANMFLLKRTKNVPLAAAVMLFCMFSIHMANVTFAGGIDTVHYAWIFIFPVLAGGTMGWRGQLFFYFISVVGTVFYFIWPEQMDLLPYEGDMDYVLATRLFCLTVFTLIMLTYYFTLHEKMEHLQKVLKLASFESDLFLGVFNSKAQSVLLVDSLGNIVRANATTHELFGFPHDELIGSHVANMCRVDQGIFSTENAQQDSQEAELTTHSGKKVWVEHSSLDVNDENGKKHRLMTLEDITTRKQFESDLSHLAHFDHLTQLPNRLMIQRNIAHMLANDSASPNPFAVVFIDLDKFKDVNDMKGHEAGDAVLVEVAQRLENVIEEGDFIGRFGGDEFILLCKNYADAQHLVSKVERLQNRLLEPIVYQDSEYYIGSSVGISLFPDDGNEANDLLRKADSAMYQAKSINKGRFEFYSITQDASIKRQLQIKNALTFAIERNELSLVYQPIFNKQSDITGAEALVRWHNSTLGFVAPDEFIPVSEDNGSIGAIGLWVLDQACATLGKWQSDGHKSLKMSVNVSYKQIIGTELVDAVQACLDKHKLAGSSLVLELTERVFAEDLALVQTNITLLAQMGVETAIDDFGIAYSSLSYLQNTDFRCLKIDRSFVSNITEDKAAFNLCLAIKSMAHNLGLKVTAEGIETQEHLNALRAMGVDSYQGYYLSKPLEPHLFTQLLKSTSSS